MAGLKRRVLGIVVISAGVCAALPFRNDKPVNAPAGTSVAGGVSTAAASRDELTLQLTIPTTAVAPTAAVGGQQSIPAVANTRPAPQAQEVRRDELQAPPSIASAFEPLAVTIPIATEPSAPPANMDEAEQRHRIADGDTLEAIAELYLGSPSRWQVILEANGELLTDRNILPIGQEIRIPHVRDPSPTSPDDHLVPIPPGLLGREAR